MKVKHHLLAKSGSDCLEIIKKNIKDKENNQVKAIVVETYDIDELAAVVFSGNLNEIENFYLSVRNLRNETYEQNSVEHYFSSCHLSLGHDCNFSFDNSFEKSKWEYDANNDKHDLYCYFEPKPGHEKKLNDIIATWFNGDKDCDVSYVSGCCVFKKICLNNISNLYDLSIDNEFNHHVRRVKVSLYKGGDSLNVSSDSVCDDSSNVINANYEIPFEDLLHVKATLNKLGISKIIRERLLSLYALYNDCVVDKLQCHNISKLKDAILNLNTKLQSFINNGDKLSECEEKLTGEIDALECAIYNRIRNRLTPNAVLEYGGGVQQFLTSFGCIFETLSSALSGNSPGSFYCLISGVDKVFTEAGRLNLNINHILYPQLFVTTIWKEVSNSSFFDKVEKERTDNNNASEEYDKEKTLEIATCKLERDRLRELFENVVNKKSTYDYIRTLLYWKLDLCKQDNVYEDIKSLIDIGLIEYAIYDIFVFKFGFLGNYQLMWHYYLKTLLQSTSSYYSKGCVHKRTFNFVLLRLVLVACLMDDEKNTLKTAVESNKTTPFDYLLAPAWVESFDSVYKTGCELADVLSRYGLKDFLNNEIMETIYRIRPNEKFEIDHFWTVMKAMHKLLTNEIKNYRSPDPQFWEKLYPVERVILMLNAYISTVYELEASNPTDDNKPTLNSLPLDFKDKDKGMKSLNIDGISVSKILSDVNGGFFIPDATVRKSYFALNTTFYRTMWDLSVRED